MGGKQTNGQADKRARRQASMETKQTGEETSRDFDTVTPEALPEPSIPPFSLYVPLHSSARLFGSLWELVSCLGGRLVLASASGASRSSPREKSQREPDETCLWLFVGACCMYKEEFSLSPDF